MPVSQFAFSGLHYGAGRPYAVVLGSVQDEDLLVTTILMSEHPGVGTLVPSALWEPDPLHEVVQFHKVRSEANLTFVFETFDSTGMRTEKNHEYFFQEWWMPEAMDLVTDTTRTWHRTKYPNNGQHDFCPLTYENIGADEEEREGYLSNDVWSSVDGYNKYIRDDFLRVRQPQRTVDDSKR